MEPKVADLLARFAESPGEVLPRGVLLDDVWGTRIGSDESLTRAVSLLRKAFRTHDTATYIETVPKRGYCLTVEVSDALPEPDEPPVERTAEEARPEPLAEAAAPPEPAGFSPETEDDPEPVSKASSAAESWPLGRVVAYTGSTLLKVIGAVVLLTVVAGAITTIFVVGRTEGHGRTERRLAIAELTLPETQPGAAMEASIRERLPVAMMANGLDYGQNAEQAGLHLIIRVSEQQDRTLASTVELLNARTGEVLWTGRHTAPEGDTGALAREIVGSAAAVPGCAIKGFDVYDMTSRFMPAALRYCAAARRDPDGLAHVEAAEALIDIAADNASVWAVHAISHTLWSEAEGGRRPARLIERSMNQAAEIARPKDEPTLALATIVTGQADSRDPSEREALLRDATLGKGPLTNLARAIRAEELREQGEPTEASAVLRRIGRSDPAHPLASSGLEPVPNR
nr:winged helix-turn-helix domain-containing protein [Parvularcula maris]